MPKNNAAMLDAAKLRRLKSSIAMTGETWRRHRSMNTGAMTAATANEAQIQRFPHPQTRPCTTPKLRLVMATTMSTAPPRSGNAASRIGTLAGNDRFPSTYATASTGKPRKNAIRQLVASTASAPSDGPLAAPIDDTPLKKLVAAARWSSGVASSSNAMEEGVMHAAPMPCMARAAISNQIHGAVPARIEPIANTARPVMNTERRPSLSASRPAGTSTAPNTMV